MSFAVSVNVSATVSKVTAFTVAPTLRPVEEM